MVRGRDWSMTRLAALAVTLLLMPFAYTEPLISIRLLGTPIRGSLLQGIWQMALQGNIITASMVAFCTVGAPVTLVFSLLYLYFGQRLGLNLRPVLLMLHRLKEWVMLDIYLVGMAVASIKVKDYADVTTGLGLTSYVILTLLTILTLIKLNTGQLWQHFFPQPAPRPGVPLTGALRVCLNCRFTGLPDARGRCPRCHRRRHSLQKAWAALIAAIIMLIPANMLPISIIYLNGSRNQDTIMSLAQGNVAVAAIVFIASILVPFIKIIVLFTLLLSIHFKVRHGMGFVE